MELCHGGRSTSADGNVSAFLPERVFRRRSILPGAFSPRVTPLERGAFSWCLPERARRSPAPFPEPSGERRLRTVDALAVRRRERHTRACDACAANVPARSRSMASCALLRAAAASLSILVASTRSGLPLGKYPARSCRSRSQAHGAHRRPAPADQRLARRDVTREERLPMALQRLGNRRISVTGKVASSAPERNRKRRSAACVRSLAGEGEAGPVGSALIASTCRRSTDREGDLERPGAGSCESLAAASANSAPCSGCFIAGRTPAPAQPSRLRPRTRRFRYNGRLFARLTGAMRVQQPGSPPRCPPRPRGAIR